MGKKCLHRRRCFTRNMQQPGALPPERQMPTKGAAMAGNLKLKKRKEKVEIKKTSPALIRQRRAARLPGKLGGRSFGVQSLRESREGLAVSCASCLHLKGGRCRRCCCRACRRKSDYTLMPDFEATNRAPKTLPASWWPEQIRPGFSGWHRARNSVAARLRRCRSAGPARSSPAGGRAS